jgi:hypothetical protein
MQWLPSNGGAPCPIAEKIMTHGTHQQQNVDVGSNRGLGCTHRSRFDGGKRGRGIEAFNYGRSSEGTKYWDAFSDDRGGPTRLKPPELAASQAA